MKALDIYLNESLDLTNMLWKIDIWFMNRDEDKNKFIELVSTYKNNKASKESVQEYITTNNINIKEFVNFLHEDVNIKSDSMDYTYQLCKIIDLLNSNKKINTK